MRETDIDREKREREKGTEKDREKETAKETEKEDRKSEIHRENEKHFFSMITLIKETSEPN